MLLWTDVPSSAADPAYRLPPSDPRLDLSTNTASHGFGDDSSFFITQIHVLIYHVLSQLSVVLCLLCL